MRLLFGVIMLVIVDQISKIWARFLLLESPPISYLSDTFRLVYAENTGAFLSLGAEAPMYIRFAVMVGLNSVMLIGIGVYLFKARKISPLEQMAFALVLAGGLGNLLDRIFRQGIVIDFLNLGIGSVRTGIFNLADVMISVGILMLGWAWCLGRSALKLKSSATEKNGESIATKVISGLIVGTTTLYFADPCNAAETIIYKTSRTSGQVVLNGQIIEYNRRELIFRVQFPDTVRRLSADNIVAYAPERNQAHQQAVQALKDLQYNEALSKFASAQSQETRPWLQREIQAGQIEVLINQQNWLEAVEKYLTLINSDPLTRHQELIPLHWSDEKLTNEEKIWALGALQSDKAIERLIGTSWLVESTEYGTRAESMLREMMTNPDPLIRHLTKTQIWRRELVTDTITDGDLERWERQLLDLQEEYRSGPMFVLGLGYERIVQKELAAARFLWLTMMDTKNIPLARDATLRAADLLEEVGQISQSVQLRAEAEARFTPAD
ncbi:signal peptidase II [uncultured Rubinisphaera sp.]|uniref:signal peptidase II n=1 Tax=uncultured Rubinisphaera sp. TaxID=1678686 RepID=UPI0030DA4F8E